MAKRKVAITKLLSCILVFVILMNVMPVSVFAVNDSNSLDIKRRSVNNSINNLVSKSDISLSSNVPEKEWNKTFGGSCFDVGYSVQQTNDGGYVIAGLSGGDLSVWPPVGDVYLVKTDSRGDLMWQKTFGGPSYDEGKSVQQTLDGGYIIAGYTESGLHYEAGCRDVYLIKTDSRGDLMWQKTFGGQKWDEGKSVQQTLDGGYIVAGYTESYGAVGTNVYLIKTDASGDLMWQKTFGGNKGDQGYSVQQTSDGGYIITGVTVSYGAGLWDVYLIKTDASGNLMWEKTFGGSDCEEGNSVQQTSDGGYIIAGYTRSDGAGEADVYLVKTDASGNLMWEKTFGGSNGDGGNSVNQTSDGGYIITGYTLSYGVGGNDVYLIKTDASGNLMWQKTFGGQYQDFGYSVQQTLDDDGYIITGWTSSHGAGGGDVWLIKVKGDVKLMPEIEITSISPSPGTTLNAGDTVTFTVNVDYDLGPSDYGKIRLSVNQYTTGTTDKVYSIGTFDPHSGSYTFNHTETIGDDWENVYVTVKLYAAKQGEPLPTPYTDFDYKHYPVEGGGGAGSIEITSISPSPGTTLNAGDTVIFTVNADYDLGQSDYGKIVLSINQYTGGPTDQEYHISAFAPHSGSHTFTCSETIGDDWKNVYVSVKLYAAKQGEPLPTPYSDFDYKHFPVEGGGGGECIESVPSGHWKGEYYNNKNLEGSPSMVRDDGTGYLNFDWDKGSPSTSCGIGSDFFSVRWTRTMNFDSGTWRFTATTDDGMRVYVDGSLVIDKWFNQVATTYIADVDLTAGTHTIKVEYYEYDQTAVAKLSWEKGDGKEIKFTGTATDYWVSGGQIHHWTVLVDEVISGPQPCEDQVDIMVYDSEFPPPWGYVDPNLNVGDRVEVYGRYYAGHCSAMHLYGSTDYYIKIGEDKKPDLAFKEIYFRDGANDITVAESGQRVSAHLTLMNKGEKDVDKAKVELYIKKEGEDTLLDSKDIYDIAADSRLGFALYFNSPSESDSYNIYAIVDRENIVDEGPYEDNNKISTELKVLGESRHLKAKLIHPDKGRHMFYWDEERHIPIKVELFDTSNNRKIDFIENAKLEGYIDAIPIKGPKPNIKLSGLSFQKWDMDDRYVYIFDTHQYKQTYGARFRVDPKDMSDVESIAFVWGEYWVHTPSFSYPPNEDKPEDIESIELADITIGYFTIGRSECFLIDQLAYPFWYAIIKSSLVSCVSDFFLVPSLFILVSRVIEALISDNQEKLAKILAEYVIEKKLDVGCFIELLTFITENLNGVGEWAKNLQFWTLGSPGTLHVYDQDGKHVGVNSTGEIDEEIPGVFYLGPDTYPQKVIILNSSRNLKIMVKAIEEGKFNLIGEVKEVNRNQKIEYIGVSVFPNTKAEIDISISNPDYTMEIDEDGDGNIDYTRNPDSVNNLPVAQFTFSPSQPFVNHPITFYASSSSDPDGYIVTHLWGFGDGNSGTGETIEHSYTSAGNYDVTLTVTDNTGLKASVEKTITVYKSHIPVNLLVNPGFEQGLGHWNSTEGSANYIWDNRGGDYCIKGIETNKWNLGRLYQDVTEKVEAGERYKIGGWIKTENVEGSVVIGLNYVLPSGWTPANGYVKEIGHVTGTTGWTYYESEWFTLPPMPEDCVASWFLFDFNNGKGTAYWDDVSLTPKPTPTPPPPEEGSISIHSSPSGAIIGLETPVGMFVEPTVKTPYTFANVPVGTSTITLSLNGYLDWSTNVQVRAGETTYVDATLSPKPTPPPPITRAIIVNKSSGWGHTVSPTGDWVDIDYDTSRWIIGKAPFANLNPGACPSGITIFPLNTTLYVRYEFELKKIPTSGKLYLAYDNDISVYLNGQKVFSKQKEGCGAYWNDEISISGFNKGKNALACVVKDRGVASFFDAELIAYGISQRDVMAIFVGSGPI